MFAQATPRRPVVPGRIASTCRCAFRCGSWIAIAASIAGIACLLVRSCGNHPLIPLRYGAYLLLHVILPGWVAVRGAGVGRERPSLVLALVLPTGFAVEIFTFLLLSAAHVRWMTPWTPAFWLACACVQRWRQPRLRLRWPTESELGTGAALCLLCLGSVVVAVAQMYAESPLVDGWPQRPIFHDWVYLLSRAAVIKRHWPLEDPSLAGTPLQYHYFLLIHVAAASLGTGIDVAWILLRLAVVPLGIGLVLEAYALGRQVARSRGAGVMAAFLLLAAGEVSLSSRYGHPEFLGLFLRWLYVSPTFFFGIVFFGALLLTIPLLRFEAGSIVWLLLLAAAATGAKGSVVPVLLVAIAASILWSLGIERRLSYVALFYSAVVGLGFLVVYLMTMAQWGDGGVRIEAFTVCHIAAFWDQWVIPCQRFLKRELHAPDFGTWLGAAVTAAAITAGTCGVKLLGLGAVASRWIVADRAFARWLVCAAGASLVSGLACHFDANDELYFLLLTPLPLAALTGTVAIRLIERWRIASVGPRPARNGMRLIGATMVAGVVGVASIQVANTTLNLRRGWQDWLRFTSDVPVNSDLVPLYQTLAWIRTNTEPDAVLLANAFTTRTIPSGRGALVDHTTAGVYYYYSAFTGRRLWIEGPSYLSNQAEAHARLRRATDFFVGREKPPRALFEAGPAYVLVDRRIANGSNVALPRKSLVFTNGAFDVFRLHPPLRGYAATSP